jgi:hypothetical protein
MEYLFKEIVIVVFPDLFNAVPTQLKFKSVDAIMSRTHLIRLGPGIAIAYAKTPIL